MIFYDFEVFSHDWLVVLAKDGMSNIKVIVNNKYELSNYFKQNKDDVWIGYNSKHYDQHILRAILLDLDPYDLSKHIIVQKKKPYEYDKRLFTIKVNNFDVMSSFHGLKQLEGFMGIDIRESSVDFDIDRKLTEQELKSTIHYCKHDVEATIDVFMERMEEYESHVNLLNAFSIPFHNIAKSKAQLASFILKAKKSESSHVDEFYLSFPDTLKIDKYKDIVDWYKVDANMDYKEKLTTEVAGVEHIFAWGGLHGAIPKYSGEGIYLMADVASLYPALMLEYDYQSRSIPDKMIYREIRDRRLELKKAKDPTQQPMKIVLNSTYGAMKDKFNALYDPLMANNVCIAGQLLLLDLIEHLEEDCKLIQSNTDGILIKVNTREDIEKVKLIAKEWEIRTRLDLEWKEYSKVFQKDVNNYVIVDPDGKMKSKGAYVKKLDSLDYNLAIINKALVEYFINGLDVETTIRNCKNLIDFQLIVKISNKFMYGMHGEERLNEKVLRVFASKDPNDGGIFKRKTEERVDKIANTPINAFIINDNVTEMAIPDKLDLDWYITMARKRLKDFIGGSE